MYNYGKKSVAIIFNVMLILGMILFSVIGGTFAYFQIDNTISASYKLGAVSAKWQLGGVDIVGTEVAISELELSKGNSAGTNIVDGGLKLVINEGSEKVYARIRFNTTLYDEEGTRVSYSDLNNLLTFKLEGNYSISYAVDESGNSILDENSNWPIADNENNFDENGWFYYYPSTGSNVLEANNQVSIADNIVLDDNFNVAYLGYSLKIVFEFEIMQTKNMTYEAVKAEWGTVAANLLIGPTAAS